MLESVFKGVLNISLYATIVAVAIMLIKVVCGKRLSPAFHYGIWFVFLLKLVIPFDIKSMFSLFTLFNQVAPVQAKNKRYLKGPRDEERGFASHLQVSFILFQQSQASVVRFFPCCF